MPIRRRSILIATTVLAGAVVAWALAQSATRHSELAAETQYEAAVAALREQRFAEAYERGLEAASNRRYHREGLLIAGESLAKLGRPVEALAVLSEVPADGSRFAVASLLARGELFIGPLRRLAAAEATYREALELDPENIVAHERLAYVLGLQGRAWEASPHRIAVLRSGRASPIHLILLALGDSADENPETVKAFYQSDPNDVAALCGLGRMELNREHPAEARRWVAAAIDRDPRLWQAQAGWGRALWELGERDAVEKWRRELPEGADEHPAVWHVRGVVAEGLGRTDEAVDCYRRAALLDPNHLTSLHALSRLAVATRGGSHRHGRASEIGERAKADEGDKADERDKADEIGVVGSIGDVDKVLGRRAKQLEELAIAARAYQIGGTPESPRRAAQVAAQLGLCWEAWGWWELQKSQRALTADEQREQANQLAAARQDGAARCVHVIAKPLLAALDARSFPASRNSLASSRESDSRVVDRSADAATSVELPVGDATTRDEPSSHGRAIRWREVARDVGVDFVFRNGGRSETAGEFMYEFSGGAAAVLDFDRDGWPDLYLSQGADWPPSADQRRFLDQLYRNQGDGRFVEMAGTAGIFENGFSQGVAVGDFDNDGFPDLYVGNIGPNRLFRNNGDGTFDDVTVESGTAGDSWTTSCAMADLNGDGLPDLYVTNYLADDRLFDKPCLMPDGSPRLCTPHEFPAAQDRLYLNLGDGRFVDVTEKVGIKVPDGKGLGVVVGDFDGSGRLGVFVANDAVPNFLFMPDDSDKPGEPAPFALSEQAFVAGAAVDGEGRAQACMGVALGDADGDGRLDIFVTNFRNESNTLYVAKTPPDATSILFVDDTRRAGLRAPSFEMLGFGTQFLDADLDGREDLVVTNGHVGDLRHHGVEYMMRPQFFRNIGQGRYAELRGDEIGPFFDEKHLGRGLAKWDWNRDGRPDLVVNQLQEPAAIVTNETSRPGHFLDIRLSGTRSSRDAIGARVRAVVAGPNGGERVVRGQLTAGDGYMASNQRHVLLGLGDATHVLRLEVDWPSGARSVVATPAVDRELVVIEQ